jgi:hypothetical protein
MFDDIFRRLEAIEKKLDSLESTIDIVQEFNKLTVTDFTDFDIYLEDRSAWNQLKKAGIES